MPANATGDLTMMVYRDEDIEIYNNGIPAVSEAGYTSVYDSEDIAAPSRALLKPGATVTIAAHVHQTVGGLGVDIGIARIVK